MNGPNIEESPLNTEQKLPCVLVLDTSGSMSGRIGELKRGLSDFKTILQQDTIARKRVEISVVEFNDSAKVLSDFKLSDEFTVPSVKAGGLTNYVDGINEGLDILEKRKNYYKRTGQQYYRPYVILITDGAPTNTDTELDELHNRLLSLFKEGHIVFWAFGLDDADMEVLEKLSKDMNTPLKIKSDSFLNFFQWLSNSMKQVSCSSRGDTIDLNPDKFKIKSPFEFTVG